MKKGAGWVSHFVQYIGASAFLGGVFANIVLGRSHDFSLSLQEVLTSRTDILHIILFVNLPGLLIFLLTDLYKMGLIKRNRGMKLTKLVLNGLVLLITSLGILTVSIDMIDLVKGAASAGNSISKSYYSLHRIEDIAGPINLLLFLLSIGIGLKEKSE